MNASLRTLLCAQLLIAACFSIPSQGAPHGTARKSDDTTTDLGRDALRHIVQDQCVVGWSQRHDPAPCERVYLADSKTDSSGYAVLADQKGGAHYLLIPVQTMSGVESAELLDPDAPNYFAEAWHQRDLITQFVGHAVPRTAVGLAVNKVHARTQDQFHIHIECLRQEVADSLKSIGNHLADIWSPVTVAGASYDALRLTGDALDGANPFELLARLKPEARLHMGDYTLVAAGVQLPSGPGFILLAGTGQTGELLLDSTCAVAGGGG